MKTTKELVEAVEEARRDVWIDGTQEELDAFKAARLALATHALALEAELAEWRAMDERGGMRPHIKATENAMRDAAEEVAFFKAKLVTAKAEALEEAAEAIEREEKDAETAEDAAAIRAAASWLRSRAADVRAGR